MTKRVSLSHQRAAVDGKSVRVPNLIEFDRSNFRLCAEYYTALLREFKKKKAECGVLWFFVNSGGG